MDEEYRTAIKEAAEMYRGCKEKLELEKKQLEERMPLIEEGIILHKIIIGGMESLEKGLESTLPPRGEKEAGYLVFFRYFDEVNTDVEILSGEIAQSVGGEQ